MPCIAELAFTMSWEAAATLISIAAVIVVGGTWHGSVLMRLSGAIREFTAELKSIHESNERNLQEHAEFRSGIRTNDHRLTVLESQSR